MALWLDDGFDTWPEVAEAGTPAAGLYTRCGAWIARNIANGRISDAVIPGAVARMYGSSEWAQRLVDVGLWAVEGTAYRDLRHFDLNPTSAKLAELRAKKAEAGRRGGIASGRSRREAGAQASGSARASRVVEPPTQPLPSSKEGRGGRANLRRVHEFDDDGQGHCLECPLPYNNAVHGVAS